LKTYKLGGGKMRKNSFKLLAMAVIFSLLLIGCGQKDEANNTKVEKKGPITVASFIDSEGSILGQMIILVLKQNGFEVVDKTKLGTPDVLRKAILQKEIDLQIDYTGNGMYYHNDNSPVWHDAQKGYETIKKLDLEKNHLVWLTPAPANNTEMIATTKEMAEKNNLKDLNDFARYVNQGGKVKLICSQEFADNEMGLKGMEKAYGFKLKKEQLITLSHGNTAQMLKALYQGTDGVNFSLAYGTDGQLEKLNLVVLKDPKNIPPIYLPTPVIREEVLKKYPEIENLLKPVFESLDAQTLRTLNAKVAFDGLDARKVAEDYLKEKGFLK